MKLMKDRKRILRFSSSSLSCLRVKIRSTRDQMGEGVADFLLGPFVMLGNGEAEGVFVKLASAGLVAAMQRAPGEQHGDDHPVGLGTQGGLEVGLRLRKPARIEKRLAEAEKRQFVAGPLLEESLVAVDEGVVGHGLTLAAAARDSNPASGTAG